MSFFNNPVFIVLLLNTFFFENFLPRPSTNPQYSAVLPYHFQDVDLHAQIQCGISVQRMLGTASCQYQTTKNAAFLMIQHC